MFFVLDFAIINDGGDLIWQEAAEIQMKLCRNLRIAVHRGEIYILHNLLKSRHSKQLHIQAGVGCVPPI